MKIKFILFLFASVWMALIVRVFLLAVASNGYYKQLSQNNTIKHEKIVPIRAEIVDIKNRPLAVNKLGFKIELAPHLLRKKNRKRFENIIAFLHKTIPSLNMKNIRRAYKKKDSFYNHDFIEVVEYIPYKEIIPLYTKLNLQEDMKIVSTSKRYYPYKNIAAHVIGYVARANEKDIANDKLVDLIGYAGKTGLEKYYNSYLQGEAGEKEIQVNADNLEVAELNYKAPVENKKLKLTLDMELEKYITKLFKGLVGAVVVMDTHGAILSAASFPNYDLNIFVSGMSYKMYNSLASSLDHPFTNKLIHGLYPPGSSVKPSLGLVYLANGIGSNDTVYCSGSIPLGKRVFRCWKRYGHKKTNMVKAIRESCDVYFYEGSLKVGIKKMSEGLLRYNLGHKTGIDLPNEFIGIVPSRAWKRKKYNQSWNKGETLNTSIGQGYFLVTPLQIAQQTALIATGKLPTPHLAYMIGDKEYKESSRDVLTQKEKVRLPIIRRGMYEVCNAQHGTATHHIDSKITIAGKTGTAQVVGIKQDIKKRKLEHELSYYTRSHAWLTTYGPYRHPQYIVTAMVEHGGHGGSAAGAIVSKIYDKLLELGYIK